VPGCRTLFLEDTAAVVEELEAEGEAVVGHVVALDSLGAARRRHVQQLLSAQRSPAWGGQQ
jgi:hypothetical protein